MLNSKLFKTELYRYKQISTKVVFLAYMIACRNYLKSSSEQRSAVKVKVWRRDKICSKAELLNISSLSFEKGV